MTNHRSSWLGDFSQPACVFLNPHIFTHSRWIILKCQLHFSCAHPAVRITESHHVCPACCRGHLPRVMVSSPPAAAENTFANCLFTRRSGSPIATEFGHADYDLPHSLCFPLFWGNHFSTDFRLPLWALSHNDPVHAVCWGFSTELLRELTVHKLRAIAWIDCSHCSISSTSHRGFPHVLPNIYGSSRRSLGHLLDVDNPSTFMITTYDLPHFADIVAYRRMTFTVSAISFRCEFSMPAGIFVSALTIDWLIDLYFWAQFDDFSLIYRCT